MPEEGFPETPQKPEISEDSKRELISHINFFLKFGSEYDDQLMERGIHQRYEISGEREVVFFAAQWGAREKTISTLRESDGLEIEIFFPVSDETRPEVVSGSYAYRFKDGVVKVSLEPTFAGGQAGRKARQERERIIYLPIEESKKAMEEFYARYGGIWLAKDANQAEVNYLNVALKEAQDRPPETWEKDKNSR